MASRGTTWQLDGRSVQVTSLDRVYWPDDGLTKGDLLGYYRDIAPILLPYFADRPVTLRTYPRGIGGPSYYRRESPVDLGDGLRDVEYQTATDQHVMRAFLIDDAVGLLRLANAGSIEFHVWGAKLPDLHEPDQIIFDLDPGDEASFENVVQAALRLHQRLEQFKLRSYPKLSGGDGVHVHLPLASGHTFDAVRDWVRDLAEELAEDHPDLIAVSHGPTHRGKLVTVDHAQNSVGRNTAAPYTVRARPGATVATPLSWDEIKPGRLNPADFTIKTVPKRVQKLGDLFAPVLQGGQHLLSR